MEKIVVPDDFPSIFSGTEALRRLQQAAHVSVYTERASSEEALIQRLQGARIAVKIRAYSQSGKFPFPSHSAIMTAPGRE